MTPRSVRNKLVKALRSDDRGLFVKTYKEHISPVYHPGLFEFLRDYLDDINNYLKVFCKKNQYPYIWRLFKDYLFIKRPTEKQAFLLFVSIKHNFWPCLTKHYGHLTFEKFLEEGFQRWLKTKKK